MSVLEFDGYSVKEIQYKKNEQFKADKTSVDLSPKLDTNYAVSDSKITVELGIKIGNTDDSDLPFGVYVKIVGNFTFNPEEDTQSIGLTEFVQKNSVAILYPYLRALVSNITNYSEDFPPYNLPTINVAQVLQNQQMDEADD